MVIYNAICLFIILAVIQSYISKDYHMHTHRLLPLVLGLSCMYSFFELFLYIFDIEKIIRPMETLLLVQLLYALFFYALDFLHISFHKWIDWFLFFILIITDTIIIQAIYAHQNFMHPVKIAVTILELMIIIIGSYAYTKNSSSKHDTYIATAVYIALILPSLGAFFTIMVPMSSGFLLPGTVAFSSLIIHYLIETDQLIEPAIFLHEKIYSNSKLPFLLFNEDFFFIDKNEAAELLFPGSLDDINNDTRIHDAFNKLISDLTSEYIESDFAINDHIYRCKLSAMYHRNKIRGYLMSFTDITDQKKETQEILEKKDYAEKQTLLKSQFLARMSHDLRTPLHAIIGISDVMISHKDLSIKNQGLVTQINNSGKNLLELVNSILDYSKLEAQKLELANQRYLIENLFIELSQMCFSNLYNRPIEFHMSVDSTYYNSVYGDPQRLREVLQNLLSNSMKYTIKGHIDCRITCTKEDLKAKYTCKISDTGIGMTQEQINQIYNEYSSYSASTSEESTGLGMTIVKQLLELFHGDIKIESDGHSGSTVTITFIQEIVDDVPSLPHEYKDSLHSISMETAYKQLPDCIYPDAKILIADDMQINIEIFREMTKPWKFKLEHANSCEAAIEMCQKNHYDLIFLDMLMPGMTGLEAAPQIKALTDAPLILLSANLITDAKKEYRDCGFSDSLPKPIHFGALKRIIESYLPDDLKRYGQIEDLGNFNQMSDSAKLRIMATFVKEMTLLKDELQEYLCNDLPTFKTKVHGIKGTAKQLSLNHLAEQAEIMEMAAKTEHIDFLKNHIENFIEELETNIFFLTKKQEYLPVKDKTQQIEQTSNDDIVKLLNTCETAFHSYRYGEIENCLLKLNMLQLNQGQKELLSKLQACFEDMDYDKGISVFHEYRTNENSTQ